MREFSTNSIEDEKIYLKKKPGKKYHEFYFDYYYGSDISNEHTSEDEEQKYNKNKKTSNDSQFPKK